MILSQLIIGGKIMMPIVAKPRQKQKIEMNSDFFFIEFNLIYLESFVSFHSN